MASKQKRLDVKDGLVVVLLLVITVISMFTFFSTCKLCIQSDGFFHFSRAEEIYQNLRKGVPFTFIATHTFQQTGVGNFLFYPDVFLYPWALLRFIFKPVLAFYVWDSLFVFLTFVIGYFCMRDYSGDRLRSVLFSIIYGLGTYHIYLGQYNFVLGEFIAYTFLPLVVLGIYHVVFSDEKKWYLLAIGLALLTYSHVLSVYIMVLFSLTVMICALFFRTWINKKRIFAIVKAFGLYCALSAWIFVPFITDYIGKGIFTPKGGFLFLSSPQQMIERSFTPNVAVAMQSIGLVAMLTAFVGWFFVRRNKREIVTYVIGVSLLLMATTFVPYSRIENISWLTKILGVIQFPYRFLSLATLFLAITASLIVVIIIRRSGSNKISKFGILALCLGGIMMCYYSEQTPVVSRLTASTSKYLRSTKTPPVSYQELINEAPGKIVNNQNYNNIFDYEVLFGQTDYYPERAFAIHPQWGSFAPRAFSTQRHVAYVNNVPTKVVPLEFPNKLSYILNLKKTATVDLPVIAYKNTKVYDNGKRIVRKESVRGTVEVHLAKGHHQVTACYVPSKMYYILLLLALFAWGALVINLLYGYRKNK